MLPPFSQHNNGYYSLDALHELLELHCRWRQQTWSYARFRTQNARVWGTAQAGTGKPRIGNCAHCNVWCNERNHGQILGLELCCTHQFAHRYLLCFAGGKEWVVIVVDDVVGNVVCWFKCSAVFGVGNLDGGVNPFFCVLEGTIAFCLRHSNVQYSFVR